MSHVSFYRSGGAKKRALAEVLREFSEAETQCDAAIKFSEESSKRNLSLYRQDSIFIAYSAAQTLYGRKSDPNAWEQARRWRTKLDARGSIFIAILDETLLLAAPKHKFEVLHWLKESKSWELPETPVPAQKESVARQQIAVLENALPRFPRGRSDVYRVSILETLIQTGAALPPQEFKQRLPSWLTDLKETAESSSVLSAPQKAGMIAFVDARLGLMKIAQAQGESQPDKKAEYFRQGMNSLTAAVRSLSSAISDKDRLTPENLGNYRIYLGKCFSHTPGYLKSGATKTEKIEHLRWLIAEYDDLDAADELVPKFRADRTRCKKELTELEK